MALLDNTAPGGTGDADPAQCVDLFLNSSVYGALAGYPMIVDNLFSTGAAPTTGDAAFQTYCQAMGFGMSPLLDSQEAGTDTLDRWATIFNTDLAWTGYSLAFVCRGAEAITANGVVYLPDNTLEFALTDANGDFIYYRGRKSRFACAELADPACRIMARSRSRIGERLQHRARLLGRSRADRSIRPAGRRQLYRARDLRALDRGDLRRALWPAALLYGQRIRVRPLARASRPMWSGARARSRIRNSESRASASSICKRRTTALFRFSSRNITARSRARRQRAPSPRPDP
jgi:hypothetical protein